jgi:hypothetical protein
VPFLTTLPSETGGGKGGLPNHSSSPFGWCDSVQIVPVSICRTFVGNPQFNHLCELLDLLLKKRMEALRQMMFLCPVDQHALKTFAMPFASCLHAGTGGVLARLYEFARLDNCFSEFFWFHCLSSGDTFKNVRRLICLGLWES